MTQEFEMRRANAMPVQGCGRLIRFAISSLPQDVSRHAPRRRFSAAEFREHAIRPTSCDPRSLLGPRCASRPFALPIMVSIYHLDATKNHPRPHYSAILSGLCV
jgi:hypothetical protein